MFAFVALSTLAVPTVAAASASEMDTDSHPPLNPAIQGNRMVWMDMRNDLTPDDSNKNYDIYMYDIIADETYQITAQLTKEENPDIWEDYIVWIDYRLGPGNGDVYVYDLGLDSDGDGIPNYKDPDRDLLNDPAEIKITNDVVQQEYPAIDSGVIVWMDWSDGSQNIRGYDLRAQTTFWLSDTTENQNYPDSDTTTENQKYPDIHGTDIVWEKILRIVFDEGDDDEKTLVYSSLHHYDLSTDTDGDGINNYLDADSIRINDTARTQLTPSEGKSFRSDVSHGMVVFQRDVDKSADQEIILYNLATGVETNISNDPNRQTIPAIFGNKVIWEDEDHQDLYVYDIRTATLDLLVDGSFLGKQKIYADIVVWEEKVSSTDYALRYQRIAGAQAPVIESFSPSMSFQVDEGDSIQLNVSIVDPDSTPDITWYVDGILQAGEILNTFDYQTDFFSGGKHLVEVKIADPDYTIKKTWYATVIDQLAPFDISPSLPLTSPNMVEGSTLTFNISATTIGPFTYAWSLDGALIPGASTNAYVHTAPTDLEGTTTQILPLTVMVDDGVNVKYHTWNVAIHYFQDRDLDGFSDQVEVDASTDPDDPMSIPVDTDGDRIPDASDPDDDNDGILDATDIDPLDAKATLPASSDALTFILLEVVGIIGALVMIMYFGKK